MKNAAAQHGWGGFALLMVVMLVAIAAVTLGAVSRTSVDKAVTAMRAERQLQRRWAIRSCQRYLLPQAEKLLQKAEEEQLQPTAAINTSITLGDETFDIIISDEQTKANVNTLYEKLGREHAADAVRSLLREADMEMPVHLKPHKTDRSSQKKLISLPVFSSYNQLFANQPLPAARLVVATVQTRPISENLTLWGNGKININRASAFVLQQACEPYLDITDMRIMLENREAYQQQRYEQLYEQSLWHEEENIDEESQSENDQQATTAPMSVADALKDIEMSDKQKAGLLKLLTDQSSCQALWLIHRTPLKSWYHLSVSEQSSEKNDEADAKDKKQQQGDSTDAPQTGKTNNDGNTAEQNPRPAKQSEQQTLPTLSVFSYEW